MIPDRQSHRVSLSIYVGMSGGVDSSVTAALLKKQGYNVTGVYMKNWTKDLPGMRCPWAEDLADAKRVAVQLGIDFKIFDFQKEYKQKVVDYMVAEYKAGRTPNPDIMCNQEVKFKLFLDAALKDGADMIATGHYAQTNNGKLLKAKDDLKDQTYFLYRITGDALKKSFLPVGGYKKSEIRKLATKFGLATAAKKDSQGICFVGEVGVKDFLGQYVKTQPGLIVDKKTGENIGTHDGAIFYTIGQRHGLGVGGGLPYYVVGKDVEKKVVYVSTNLNDDNLWRSELTLGQLHWINDPPKPGKTYQARTRHRGKLIDCKLEQFGEELKVKLSEPERAITPGQSTVFYDGGVVLGGGIVI